MESYGGTVLIIELLNFELLKAIKLTNQQLISTSTPQQFKLQQLNNEHNWN